ncbi:hypothetical protein MVEN_00758600 [Mycena venus]|uniref:Uncharacterized protein n=1 Tax=Mycena venus TaxID=2733690 RepID=A0A8H6YKK2_9AGAR|nr:hypothetical protein MVEN_00758600 [Mycena venus]
MTAHAWPLLIPTFNLVAWWIKFWVYPLLYRSVFLRMPRERGLYRYGVSTVIPSSTAMSYLMLYDLNRHDSLQTAFAIFSFRFCPQKTESYNFGLQKGQSLGQFLEEGTESSIPPDRESILISPIDSFVNVTHLEIFDQPMRVNADVW